MALILLHIFRFINFRRFVFSQAHDITGAFAAVFLNGGIVLAGCVYVLVAEYVRDQLDIPCSPVEAGSIGAAQLMGGDLFE